MNWEQIAKNWPAFTESVKARWPDVDAEEVADLDGSRSALNAYLGRVAGLTPREAEEQIDEWLQGPIPIDAATSEFHDNDSIRESGRHVREGEDVWSDDRDFGDDRVATPPVGRDTDR